MLSGYVVGGFISLLGLTILVLSFVLRIPKWLNNGITGLLLMIAGVSIIWLQWLAEDPNYVITINLGVSDEYTGVFLFITVIALLAIRAIMDYRGGSKYRRLMNTSAQNRLFGRFSTVVGIILLAFALFAFIILFIALGLP